jgi:hypothetical protein
MYAYYRRCPTCAACATTTWMRKTEPLGRWACPVCNFAADDPGECRFYELLRKTKAVLPEATHA